MKVACIAVGVLLLGHVVSRTVQHPVVASTPGAETEGAGDEPGVDVSAEPAKAFWRRLLFLGPKSAVEVVDEVEHDAESTEDEVEHGEEGAEDQTPASTAQEGELEVTAVEGDQDNTSSMNADIDEQGDEALPLVAKVALCFVLVIAALPSIYLFIITSIEDGLLRGCLFLSLTLFPILGLAAALFVDPLTTTTRLPVLNVWALGQRLFASMHPSPYWVHVPALWPKVDALHQALCTARLQYWVSYMTGHFLVAVLMGTILLQVVRYLPPIQKKTCLRSLVSYL